MNSMKPSSTNGNSSTRNPIMSASIVPHPKRSDVRLVGLTACLPAAVRARTPRRADPHARAASTANWPSSIPTRTPSWTSATPLELSVATILSAQCTDKRVNEVTPVLFRRYPTAADYAGADRDELEQLIRPTGFFRNKTTSLIKLGPGAGRELRRRGAAHAQRAGHAARLRPQDRQRRARQCLRHPGHHRRHPLRPAGPSLGVDRRDRPGQGRAVVDAADSRSRTGRVLSHRVIWHGRRMCHARKPACGACPVARLCPSYGEGPTDPAAAAKLVKTVGTDGRIDCDDRRELPPPAGFGRLPRPRAVEPAGEMSRFLPPEDGSGRRVRGSHRAQRDADAPACC